MSKPRLHLNPHCPRWATTPVTAEGRFDNERFGKFITMQEQGATLEDFIQTMTKTTMEDIPLVRERRSSLPGIEVDGYECHPATWDLMPESFRDRFLLVG